LIVPRIARPAQGPPTGDPSSPGSDIEPEEAGERRPRVRRGDDRGFHPLLLLWLIPLTVLIGIAVLVTEELESLPLGLMAACIAFILATAIAYSVRPSGRN
jgi:hypothetical protein